MLFCLSVIAKLEHAALDSEVTNNVDNMQFNILLNFILHFLNYWIANLTLNINISANSYNTIPVSVKVADIIS